MAIISQSASSLIISNQEKKDFRELIYLLSKKFSDRQIATILGTLNAYIWRAAVNYGAIFKTTKIDGETIKNIWEVRSENLDQLLLESAAGMVHIEVAQQWLSEYLQEHWQKCKVFHSVPTLSVIRKFLADVVGLFTFDHNRPKGGKWGADNDCPGEGVATPPIFESFSFVKALLTFQTFYKVYRDRKDKKLKFGDNKEDKTSFDCLPDHGAAVVIECFNATFIGIEDFAGNLEGVPRSLDLFVEPSNQESTDESEESLPKLVRWKWKRFKKLAKQTWINLVVKGGQVVDDLLIPLGEPPVICPSLEDMMKFVPF